MNNLKSSDDIFLYFVKNPIISRIFLAFLAISLLVIVYDIMMNFGYLAFTMSDGNSHNYARCIHFIAVTFRLMLVVLMMIFLFYKMFGNQLGSIVTCLKKNPMAIIGFFILSLLVVLAVYADFIANYETVVIKQNLSNTFVAPNSKHILGTDDLGRDIFARIVHGTRISLSIGFISVFISILIGGFLGATAGYFGGWLDNVVMRTMDVFLAIPSILLSIAVVSALGPSLMNLVIALSVSTIPVYARIVRASVLSIRRQEFIEAAHAIGASDFYIIVRHVISNVLSPVIVQGTLGVANAILSIAGLSFIGLGIQPPTPEWGSMLASGRSFMRNAPGVTTYPGIAIMLSILSLNLLGDGLRDALDPRLK